MKLTPEQQAVADAATDPSRPRITVIGYAGAAKTTTMLAVAKAKDAHNESGSAFFFNKAMAEEMKEKIVEDGIMGLSASTLHSLAYREMKRQHGARVGERLIASDVAKRLGFGYVDLPCLSRPITPSGAAYIAMRSMSAYCQSDDTEMSDHHLRAGDHEAATYRHLVRDRLKPHSYQMVQAVFAPDSTMAMPHDVYLKTYIEDVTKGSRMGPGGSYLIGDEFQDSNGVTMKLMRTMSAAGSQIIVAGDPFQQIYQWRGSVDAMHRIETDVRLELTQSFRYGQRLADLASAILAMLGATVSINGNPNINTHIQTAPESGSSRPHAIICRSNQGVIDAAQGLMMKGQPCYIPRAKTMVNIIEDIEALWNGKPATRTELRIFSSYDSFLEYADKSSDGGDYKRLVKTIEEVGSQRLLRLLTAASVESEDATIVLTAQGSKGLQFETVRLASDFPSKKDIEDHPDNSQEEIRLMYVAATRAQRRLDLSGCPILAELCRDSVDEKAAA